jgi:hypothetical protein
VLAVAVLTLVLVVLVVVLMVEQMGRHRQQLLTLVAAVEDLETLEQLVGEEDRVEQGVLELL